MLFRDIRNRLGMRLVLSMRTGSPIEKFTQEHGIFIPASLVVSRDFIGSLYFFDKSMLEGRDMDIFLRAYGARESNGKYTLFASDRTFPQYRFFGRSLLDLPSVIPDAHFVDGCCHYFHFRFHSSMIGKVSELMLSEEVPAGMSIEYLGKSDPDHDVVDFVSGKVPLNFVSIVSRPPDIELFSSERNPIQSGEWKRETKYLRTDGKIRSIFYIDKPLEEIPPGVVEISREEGIYEAETENPVLSEIAGLSPHITLPALSRSQSLSGERFEMQCVGPSMFERELMERIKAAKDKFPDWELAISGVEALG